MSSFILNRFTVNTNGGNLIRTCYLETRQDYLIIKFSDCLSMKWKFASWMKQNHSSSFSFISNNIISLLSSRKKASISQKLPLYVFWETRVSCYKLCEENKSIKLQMLAWKKWNYHICYFNVLMNLKWTKFNVNHYNNPDRLDKQ